MYQPKNSPTKNSHITSLDHYKNLYEDSIKSPENFWGKIAERIDWIKVWNRVSYHDFIKGEINWFAGGKLNASYNCIDRHVESGFGDEIAIIWEGNDPKQSRKFTYLELLKEVSLFANALKSL